MILSKTNNRSREDRAPWGPAKRRDRAFADYVARGSGLLGLGDLQRLACATSAHGRHLRRPRYAATPLSNAAWDRYRAAFPTAAAPTLLHHVKILP